MHVPKFLAERGIKQVLTLDWETYFDKDYSLRKQKVSTSQYIRDERFKAHGIGLHKWGYESVHWVTHADLKSKLAAIDWSTTAILAHHTHFDGLILTHHFGHIPAYYLDTLSMARVWIDHSFGHSLDSVAMYYDLGNKIPDVLMETKGIYDLPANLENKLAAYCKQDVRLTSDIFQIMWEEGFPQDELDLIDITVRMFVEPIINVNKELANEELIRVREHNARLIKSVAPYLHLSRSLSPEDRLAKTKKVLASDNQLADALRDLEVKVPMKTTPTGNRKPAFAKNDLAFHKLQVHSDKRVRKICEARLAVKSTVEEAKASRLLLHANPTFPVYLNYGKAHTYRWTGGDLINPQNFPRGGKLRKCLMAPAGHQLVVVDSGQIEARVVAWLAEQWDLLEKFSDPKQDPYCEYASEIFDKPITKKDKNERFVGKVGILGLGYGMGWAKYQYTLESGAMGMKVFIDEAQANKAVTLYRNRHKKIVAFWKTMEGMLNVMINDQGTEKSIKNCITFKYNAVELPNKLELHYRNIHKKTTIDNSKVLGIEYFNGRKFTKIYGGLFTENLTQAIARIIVANQMLRIAEKYRVVMMTHDEVVYISPNVEAKRALDFGIEVMSSSEGWYQDIPLAAEGGYAREYSK